MKEKYCKNIIIGAGASGLYCACILGGDTLILEKTARAGNKLLMSGNGQCNITHGGLVKDFIKHYGENGRRIRGILQKHSNAKLCGFIESIGVPLAEREDGKIFPISLKSKDVSEALLKEISLNGGEIKYSSPVVKIIARSLQDESALRLGGSHDESGMRNASFVVESGGGTFGCENLIIATGGCSYPKTGSDGSMFGILKRDLSVAISEPKPSLTPVYVENYGYGDLSGISFRDISMDISGKTFRGDLLFTRKNLSGPLMLNNSRYLRPGARFSLNFLAPAGGPETAARFKRDFPGGGKSPQNYMCEDLGLPKRFAQKTAAELGISRKKVSQLSGGEIKQLTEALTSASFVVSGLAGFDEAMATKGGAALSEFDLSCMRVKKYEGLYIIGEAADVDGDTGGYNLQFAFSSAWAAAEDILKREGRKPRSVPASKILRGF